MEWICDYKTHLKNDLDNKSNILDVNDRNIAGDDVINGEDENLYEQFIQVCSQFIDFIDASDLKDIIPYLRIIQKTVCTYKSSCLTEIVQFRLFELIVDLLNSSSNDIRILAAETIKILIENIKDILQFFYQIDNFTELLLQTIDVCDDVNSTYFALFSLYYFFEKYYKINPDLFAEKVTFQYLDSIYNKMEQICIDDVDDNEMGIYYYISMFYRKLSKNSIDPSEYETIISFIITLFEKVIDDYEILYPNLFKILSNLINYDNMPKEDFLESNFLKYTIQEIIPYRPESNITAYDLLSSIFNKGLQVNEILSLESDGEENFFDRLINYALNSIENNRSESVADGILEEEDKYKGEISAAATRMLTSAIQNDEDNKLVNILVSCQNNNYGFLSIIDNLCNSNSIFSLTQASSHCLVEILSRVTQSQMMNMNEIVFISRENENNKIMYRSLVIALIAISTMDDENLVLNSLKLLFNLIIIPYTDEILKWMAHDYHSFDGYEKMEDISEQYDNCEIQNLCGEIQQFFSPKAQEED